MLNLNLNCRLSSKGYDKKPSEKENGKITNQLKQNQLNITPRQLAEYLCFGHTVCATHPDKSKSEKKDNAMWFIGFDFDHMKMSMDQRLNRLTDLPTIAYNTFSHSPSDIRYRFIYVFSSPFYGCEFYSLQKTLKERNYFDDCDTNAENINRLFHGTTNPVYFSGICYDKELNAEKEEKEELITRNMATPPPIVNTPAIYNNTYTYTEADLSLLTSVGVTTEVADYYYTHSWGEFLSDYTPKPILREESEYIQVEGECYAVAPDQYYSLPRQWWYSRDENGHVVTNPRMWKDGENRGGKLYQAIITIRQLNPNTSADDLLYGVVGEYTTFYRNHNADKKTCKYDHAGLARQFVNGMNADIEKPRIPLKHPSIHITSVTVKKHVEAPKACAKERHKKILSLYDSKEDLENNLQRIQETLKIHLTERTLKKILREGNAPDTAHKLSTEEKEQLFKSLYDPYKSDSDNLQTLQDNITISRATYYRWKKQWATHG